MDAHADIDENVLKDEGVLRCPRNGHVLYMQVGMDVEDDEQQITQVKGPTIVFPTRKVAWGTVTPRTIPTTNLASYNSYVNIEERVQEYIVDVENYWTEEEKEQFGYTNVVNEDDDDDDSEETLYDEMTIVPAVNGRLLRFNGAAFHSVPKPPHRYLMSEDDLKAYLDKECEEEDDIDDEYWDDDFDDDDDDEEEEDRREQRSVLLFNTWSEGSAGPRGVLPDCIVDAIPDGISFEDDDGDSNDTREDEQWQKWKAQLGNNFEQIKCNPVTEWKVENIEQLRDHALSDVTIPLMGNPARRGCTLNKSKRKGSVSNEAFHSNGEVSSVKLKRVDG